MEEKKIIARFFEKQFDKYQSAPEEAMKAITFGESEPAKDLNSSELAAWSLVANLILNMEIYKYHCLVKMLFQIFGNVTGSGIEGDMGSFLERCFQCCTLSFDAFFTFRSFQRRLHLFLHLLELRHRSGKSLL